MLKIQYEGLLDVFDKKVKSTDELKTILSASEGVSSVDVKHYTMDSFDASQKTIITIMLVQTGIQLAQFLYELSKSAREKNRKIEITVNNQPIIINESDSPTNIQNNINIKL